MSADPENDTKPSEAPPNPSLPEHPFEEGEEAPPPGVRTMAIVRWILLVLVIIAAVFSLASFAVPLFAEGAPSEQKTPRYHCPMHPQIVSDQPGECPICHMSLEPIPESAKATAPTAPTAPTPALVPSSSARAAAPMPAPTPSASSDGGAPPAAHDGTPSTAGSAPPDTTPITLSLDRTQAIGVRTALVERRSSSDPLRVTAVVETPEQGRAEVHVRAPGYVEAINVRDVGVKVKAGETLAAIYAPEVFQAEQELLAMRGWTAPATTGSPTDAARQKLQLLGLGTDAIDRILASGKPVRAVGISSPIDGYVVEKNVVLGSYVTTDKPLFRIADLRRVYIIASVYPRQIEAIRVGEPATFATPSLPGRTFETKVDLVYPDVDLATRTARVRLRVDNAGLVLRPGQIGTVELRGATADVLTIPRDAVVDTGRAVYVFLAGEGGRFEARTVVLGGQVGDRFIVDRGLAEGDRVVSGATFLIDAESRLQASLTAVSPAPPGTGAAEGGTAAPPADAVALPPSRCDVDFDRGKFPEKWQQCRQCEVVHRGMGTMEQDCKSTIPKPWR
ncbi:MAG: efflux RND transporter periplasmic adaptor subunit [Byssovorax sp.]